MLESLSLSWFGLFHTAIALVAVTAGIAALFRYGVIDSGTRPGWLYLWLTVATSVTGLFIFRHGGFGPPHALAILTLVVLAVCWFADRRSRADPRWRYLAVPGYS